MHALGSRASSTNSSRSFIGDTLFHGDGIPPPYRTPRPKSVTDVLALLCHRCDGTTPAARGSRVAVGVLRSRLTPHASPASRTAHGHEHEHGHALAGPPDPITTPNFPTSRSYRAPASGVPAPGRAPGGAPGTPPSVSGGTSSR